MTKVYIILACYILFPILIIEGFKRWTIVQKIGTVVLAYAAGIIASLCGVFEFATPEITSSFEKVQKLMMNVAVPLAIPLMLFNCDFKLWTKALPKTAWALVTGLVAILVSVVSGYFIFRNHVPDTANVSGMMTGIYTGGTMNFTALGNALQVEKTVISIVLAFEMVITTPYIFFLLGGGYKIFRKILPYKDITHKGRMDEDEVETNDVENYRGMFEKKNFWGMMKGLGLSFVFLAIGAGLAMLITGTLNDLVVILTITTLAIIASFFKKVRELPKTFELGMFFILIFSVIVASMFDINSVRGKSLYIGGFVGWIMLMSVTLHLILCRIAKVSGDLFCVSQVGLLCSPPFVPPVAGAMKNKKVLISGIVIGLIGYAVGTYMGTLVAIVLGSL
jgi:uncharacterized membrane protein